MNASLTSGGEGPLKPAFPSTPPERARCSSCGSSLHGQLPQQTQLDADYFVPKTHPRIELRGRIDALHALLQMAAHQEISGPNTAWIRAALHDLIEYVKELGSAEFHVRPAHPIHINGLDGETLNRLSHHPDQLGLEHGFIAPDSATLTHWLNIARTAARATELDAWNQARGPEDVPFQSIALGFNLVSSSLYYLELLSATSLAVDHTQTSED